MDEETVTAAVEHLRDIAATHGIAIDRLIVFGSRTREDYRDRSDIDILLVSPEFEDIPYYKRARPFNTEWAYESLPPPELICLAPEEFEDKRRRKPHIVRTAVEEGISIP